MTIAKSKVPDTNNINNFIASKDSNNLIIRINKVQKIFLTNQYLRQCEILVQKHKRIPKLLQFSFQVLTNFRFFYQTFINFAYILQQIEK
ncbi:hypothetical protein BpHYR1_029732 [Brachionus plicatilis]|uniref:Uncharacterized protein n=1 Tax=Brachionus plicatilis TaxID=10195 RepID=A0A3M7SRW5_BRAPC|nr:hypothetical protein BpHYR1_029732 [Brachionus plicatilis]